MMFFLSLFSIILFSVWLCRVSAQEAPQKQALLLGVSLLMINLYFSTQTSRQFIATILLLFAITEKSLFIRFALLALASAFHITRSEEHTSELQSLMRISYAVFCLKKKQIIHKQKNSNNTTNTKN